MTVASRGAIWARLLRQGRPYWLHLGGILAVGLAATPVALLGPLPLKIVVDSALGSHPLPAWLASLLPAGLERSWMAVVTLACGLLMTTTVLVYAQALVAWLLQTYTGEKLVLDFRADMFRHIQRLSLTYHDAAGTTDSTYRIQYDAPSIQHVLVSSGIPLLTAAATLAGMVSVTAILSWKLAAVALAVSPVLLVLTLGFGRRLRARWHDLKRFESSAMGVVQETLGALRVVKAFGGEEQEQRRFLDRSRARLRGQLGVASMQGSLDLLVGITVAAGTAATLFIGVSEVRAGAMTLGSLLLVMAYLAQIYEPLKSMSKKIADVQAGLASAERAFAVLDRAPEVSEHPHARGLTRARGEVEFRDVGFAYPGGPAVLDGISFHVAPGTTVGISGRTGAGKTTLTALLMRFYDPASGQVLLDGTDIRQYRLADLRNQFAIVLQEPVLFSTSIAENIRYGNPHAGDDEVVRAAKLANAHEFITALPEGYQTPVGERGMRLSGGERQRVSLARAFLKDAPLLVLDEPTSSVDAGTEAVILEAMERLMAGRTVFMIAHRLGTLEGCEMRLEIEGGRIATCAAATPLRLEGEP